MMKAKYLLYGFLVAITFTACGNKEKKSYDTIGKSGMTTRTEFLNENLRTFKDKGVLVGHEYGTLQGVGWQNDSARSDFASICSDNPACVGYELSGLEKDKKQNVDSLRFDAMRKNIIDYFHRGGLVTLSWTPSCVLGNPYGDQMKLDATATKALFDARTMNTLQAWTKKVASYISSLQDGYGIKVPVVLNLYPLNGKSWYCGLQAGDYTKLYQQTRKWLLEDSVTNVIFAYSQSMVGDESEFMASFPGDGVDVINFCYVQKGGTSATYKEVMNKMLPMLSEFGIAHHKIIGVNTGIEGVPDKTFWSETLLPMLKTSKLSYLMLGRNYGDAKDKHYCAPYPGEESVPDFVKMYNDESTIFLSEVNGLYLDHPKQVK
jgi:mannan endo-1,4-beta-mannosidase